MQSINPDQNLLGYFNKVRQLEGSRILLADDNADYLELTKQLLENFGAIVSAVEDGARAVEEALKSSYDLIILDLDMPELDGLCAAEYLRSRSIKVPLIALTSHRLPGDVLNAHAAGFTDHLEKPITKDTLFRAVKNALHL